VTAIRKTRAIRIALINLIPKTNAANYLGFNHGLAYLSSILKRNGHQTRLFSIATQDKRQSAELSDFRPDTLFIYLTTNQYALFESKLREQWCGLGVPIFVGGPHATSCPENLLLLDGISGVCIGEGETSALLIAQRIEQGDSFDNVPNIWFKRGDRIVKNDTGYCEAYVFCPRIPLSYVAEIGFSKLFNYPPLLEFHGLINTISTNCLPHCLGFRAILSIRDFLSRVYRKTHDRLEIPCFQAVTMFRSFLTSIDPESRTVI
jgi:radical SAM superfamily enzyme YgiQ (UPF0313 family)